MTKAVIFDMFETLITHFDMPPYFGTEMAQDAGIEVDRFLPVWRDTDDLRTLGKTHIKEVLTDILRSNDKYSEEVLRLLIDKRIAHKKECFSHLNPQIIPMLTKLRDQGIKVGLITNCYSEELFVISHSILFKYFDETCFSCIEGIMKPDKKIYERMLRKLGLEANECVYIGDGGSHELEAAQNIGMKTFQATWYLQDGNPNQMTKLDSFEQISYPLAVLDHL